MPKPIGHAFVTPGFRRPFGLALAAHALLAIFVVGRIFLSAPELPRDENESIMQAVAITDPRVVSTLEPVLSTHTPPTVQPNDPTEALSETVQSPNDPFPAPAPLSAPSIQPVVREHALIEKQAIEKVAAEKALAEKVAQEKRLAEKSMAEKKAAEKAAADKLAAEKAVADKLAAEKAVADKLAAERAAAEKAAAEALVAQKAAALEAAKREQESQNAKIAALKEKFETFAKQKQQAVEAARIKAEQDKIQQALQQQAAAHSSAVSAQVDKYKSLILHAIGQQWIPPESATSQQRAKLLVRLAPDGTVLSVTLLQPSGNIALDRSAEAAVFKASPLPVPSDHDAFSPFQNLHLTVRKEGVLS